MRASSPVHGECRAHDVQEVGHGLAARAERGVVAWQRRQRTHCQHLPLSNALVAAGFRYTWYGCKMPEQQKLVFKGIGPMPGRRGSPTPHLEHRRVRAVDPAIRTVNADAHQQRARSRQTFHHAVPLLLLLEISHAVKTQAASCRDCGTRKNGRPLPFERALLPTRNICRRCFSWCARGPRTGPSRAPLDCYGTLCL